MNVLIVNRQYQLGGAETVAQQLHQGISGARMMVVEGVRLPKTIATLYPRSLSRANHSRFHRLVQSVFPVERISNRRFRRLVRDQADIIHLHNFHGDYATVESLAFVARTKPIVWTFHGMWGATGGCDFPGNCARYQSHCGKCPQVGSWPIGPVDRTAEDLAEKRNYFRNLPLHVVAPSRYFAEMIQKSPVAQGWRIHHIANGVNVDLFRPAQAGDGPLRVLLVARDFLDGRKRFDLTKEALHLFSRDFAEAFEVLVAGASSAWACRELESVGVRAIDYGYVQDRGILAGIFGSAHVFLFTSSSENAPCVILEAMASGCCVVATPSSGLDEQIRSGHDGIIARAIEADEVAASLRFAFHSRDRLRSVGVRARERVVREFSETMMVEKYLALYRSILPSTGPDRVPVG